MKILKFGGSSVAKSDRIKGIGTLIKTRVDAGEKLAVVFSAFGGVTDDLISLANKAEEGDDSYLEDLKNLRLRHQESVDALLPEDMASTIKEEVDKRLDELSNILHGAFLVKEASPRTMDFVQSFGERNSAFIISKYFSSIGIQALYCDARNLVRTNNEFGAAKVDFDVTNTQINAHFDSTQGSVNVITGFIGKCKEGLTTTLGRGGSDYTASIFSAALQAEALEIWTDVDGVLTSNPRVVRNAYTVPELSYNEAMELSHFGAKVIYPPTIQPALSKSIPIFIKNTFNPTHPGTRISSQTSEEHKDSITGLTSVSDISLITLEGSGLVGIPGTAARFFSCLGRAKVNVIMITQASSEHSICIAVKDAQSDSAQTALTSEFEREIEGGFLMTPAVVSNYSILAMVGEGMKSRPGLAGRLFSSLGRNGINVAAVAQGSSELNVTFAIHESDEHKALNLIHDAFFLSQTNKVHVFLMGVGLIGGTLVDQIERQHNLLKQEKQLDIKIIGMANSRKMLFNREGLELGNWKNQLEELGQESSFEAFTNTMVELNLPNSIFVDCTANPEVKNHYPAMLANSISISTANKVAASSSQEEFDALNELALKNNAQFLFETNVGAGLPLISTLKGLVESGDKVTQISAVISGSLSFIFNNYSPDKQFKDLVTLAREKGFTEPDPREDLSGNDIKRKIIILSRVAGHQIEPDDVEVEALLPDSCMNAKTVDDFFKELDNEAEYFKNIIKEADAAQSKLRYIAYFEDGKASIKLQKVEEDSPFYNLASTDNMIVFHTERYQERPLVVSGPGAGADVTAAGVFAEIIQYGNSID